MPTYYELFDLALDDPPEKVQARYRLLVRQVHPDAGGSGDDFRRYTEAYHILGDSERRKRYNQQIGVYCVPRPLHEGYDLYQRVQVSPDLAQRGGGVPLVF